MHPAVGIGVRLCQLHTHTQYKNTQICKYFTREFGITTASSSLGEVCDFGATMPWENKQQQHYNLVCWSKQRQTEYTALLLE